MQELLDSAAFNFLVEDTKASLATNEELRGLDLREDTYRKACMKDGIDLMVHRAKTMADPNIGKEEG